MASFREMDRCHHLSPELVRLLDGAVGLGSWKELKAWIHPEDREGIEAWRVAPWGEGYDFRLVTSRGEIRRLRGHFLTEGPGAWHLLVQDLTDLHRAEVSLEHLRLGASGLSGSAFFRALVIHLAAAFEAPYALAGELVGDDRVRTLAMCDHGELREEITYPLAGTPCADVVQAKACFHPHGVHLRYPLDEVLGEMGIEGYLGTTLVDSHGRVLGVLCVMSREPLSPHPGMMDLLSVFSARAGLELERIRNEEALHQTQQLLQGLERMNAMASLGAGLAHDLNNLLAVIQNYAELCELEMEEGQTPSAHHVARVKEASMRAGALTAQLMSYGRGRKGQVERFEAGERLQRLGGLLRAALPPKVSLELDLAAGPIWLEADPTQLDQMVANLVLNARDALPQGGRIQVGCATLPQGAVRLTVRDDGMGMPPEVVARLGEPFFTTKGEGRGTGLGLASVRSILEKLGGGLQVESAPGRGTTFHLEIPLKSCGASARR
ncbi:MAG TPA: ATP-binding protein [Holophagaceae bacterium]|nr:ATP-binding protein [Holophagaceae bacterium]